MRYLLYHSESDCYWVVSDQMNRDKAIGEGDGFIDDVTGIKVHEDTYKRLCEESKQVEAVIIPFVVARGHSHG